MHYDIVFMASTSWWDGEQVCWVKGLKVNAGKTKLMVGGGGG